MDSRPMLSGAAHPDGVIPLAALTRADREMVGAKAATLGELAQAGFRVPQGFVVTGAVEIPDGPGVAGGAANAVRTAVRRLGDAPVAVRSSAIAEDLADASFAGQYETVLDVRGADAVLGAIRRVRESAAAVRVREYVAARAGASVSGAGAHGSDVAVLVQRMLVPAAAGVAFTANPVTGDRTEVVITAARGLGERVVAGEAVGDEWAVRDHLATCRRSVEQAIDAEQAAAIAQLAGRAAAHLGAPQDVEWAIERGRLYLLQARPMTALPEPVDWTPPSPGYWMRTFRLGEWLPEPMTPLFRDWLLERIEAGYLDGMRQTAGAAVPFRYAAINGWYYTAPPAPRAIPGLLLRALAQSRGRVLHLILNGLLRPGTQPEVADRNLLRGLARHWREELLPHYRAVVAEGERLVETATPTALGQLVDDVGRLAGEYLWSLAIVGGSAWKMEGCLAAFVRRHVPQDLPDLGAGVQVLLCGLPGMSAAALAVPGHAVQSVDWYWPTAGEQGWAHSTADDRDRADASPDRRRDRLSAERERATAACRQALADRPALLARFDALLEVTQRYAGLREEQARWFTLGWPLLRRCALRLGEAARAAGVVDGSEDVFFLTRAELRGAALLPSRAAMGHDAAGLQEEVHRRRDVWEHQRRLVAPLTLGVAPRLLERTLAGAVEAVRTGGRPPEGAIVGQPASPGRATGSVRVVRDPADFDRFQAGDVLVARATAPAWTPLFGRAAAVVTDGGTLAAHASLVAREYGIPAVVGTGDATARLRDGQVVVVDGSAGTVILAIG